MSIDNTTTEKYGVTRGDNLLHVYPTIDEAKQQHAHITQTMDSLGLTPDVDLVTVTEKVTYSKPKPYKEDAPVEPDTTEPDADTTDTE